jgi:hypothetical protein
MLKSPCSHQSAVRKVSGNENVSRLLAREEPMDPLRPSEREHNAVNPNPSRSVSLMKHLSSFKCGIVLCGLMLSAGSAFSQGAAFTYQGRLDNGGSPVTGLYDFTNALYNASSGGAQVGSTVTLTAVPVTNGLFTVQLDFDGVFNGTAYWLQIGVCSNGVGSYVTLSPRQQLTPTPYAITAENVIGLVSASQLVGPLPGSLFTGGGPYNLNNAGNSFTGNGAGLTGVNALSLGGLGPNSFWKTLGNAGTTAGVNFVGTTDNQAFDLRASNTRILRLDPGTVYGGIPVPNVIGGSPGNFVAAGTVGNVIAGGASAGEGYTNYITGENYNTISGGVNNHITNGYENVIAGGYNNTIGVGNHNTIGGGYQNTVTGNGGTVPGGEHNTAAGDYSFAAGQNAQAMHSGAFVWADSSGGAFASTANNQFLVRAGFMGLNRATQVSGSEYFGILAPVSNTWGGMYIQTLTAGRPFYGYNNPSGTSWTEMDGTDGNKWKLYNSGYWLTVTTTGNVGFGTTTPASPVDILGYRWDLSSSEGDFRIGDPTYRLKIGVATGGGGAGDARIRAQGGTSRLMLGSITNDVLTVLGTRVGIGTINPISSLHVVGDTRIEGTTRAGSEAGTAEAPDKGLVIRRVKSTTTGIGSVVARTDKLTLERDGTTSGLRIVNVASPGSTTIAFTGLTSAGATVNSVTSFSLAAAGTNTVFTDAQNVVSLRGSFGDSYGANHMTEVSLTRYPGDYYWTGTLTSTFNQ